MKLLIAGSRDFTDLDYALRIINELINDKEIIEEDLEIISGMARGADTVAVQIAKDNDLKLHEYPANWNQYGKSAGYRRNVDMGNACDIAVIFWDGQSKGTKHMIDTLTQLNKKHFVVKY